jgi:transmembrane sensor
VAVTPLERGQIRRRTAWQAGVLTFAGDPLASAVEEFNRYRRAPILLGNPQLAALPVAGSFRAKDAAPFLRVLEQAHGVAATHGADGSIMLTAAPDGGGRKPAASR